MKYISENRLQDFEFHDAELLSISFINDCLTLEADYLNVHSDAIQNPFDVDMEIEKAVLSFSGFKVYSSRIKINGGSPFSSAFFKISSTSAYSYAAATAMTP